MSPSLFCLLFLCTQSINDNKPVLEVPVERIPAKTRSTGSHVRFVRLGEGAIPLADSVSRGISTSVASSSARGEAFSVVAQRMGTEYSPWAAQRSNTIICPIRYILCKVQPKKF